MHFCVQATSFEASKSSISLNSMPLLGLFNHNFFIFLKYAVLNFWMFCERQNVENVGEDVELNNFNTLCLEGLRKMSCLWTNTV
jgi:hypothetical protein